MATQGTVVSLQLCPGHRKPMQPVPSVEAIEKVGLKGDMHAIPESTRQVLLIEKETLDTLDIGLGAVKENITTANIGLMNLQRGQRLRAGEAVLEITGACEPCKRMEEIRPGLMAKLEGRRGMLARVITGGIIRVGDSLSLA